MQIVVQAKSGELAFECGERESILYAGLRQGITLPFECATGTCGTCRARVMAGEVDVRWPEAPGALRLKPEKGDILMCQTWARSDCMLRVPAEVVVANSALPTLRRGILRGFRILTRDVARFELTLSEPVSFEAGQFVVIETAGIAGGRAYSMVNFATDCDRLDLVIKRKPGGSFGDWLFDQLKEEPAVNVFGPLGRAVFRPTDNRNFVCIAGGSGVAGMMSILDHAIQVDYFSGHAGALYFGVRTLQDTFFLEQLSQYAAASHGNLDVVIALSEETTAAGVHAEFPRLKLACGMVHEVAAREMAVRDRNVLAYVAGPPIMVDSTIRGLISGGSAVKDIRYDKFS